MHSQIAAFCKITARPPLDDYFLSPKAVIVFDEDLAHVIWANAVGAKMFAGNGVSALLETEIPAKHPFVKQLAVAVRQIRKRPVVRGFRVAQGDRSNLIQCEVDRVSIKGHGKCIVLVCESEPHGHIEEHQAAQAAVDSLAGMAGQVAIVDEYGLPLAANAGFGELEFPPNALAKLVAQMAERKPRARSVALGPDGDRAAMVVPLAGKSGRYLVVLAEAAAETAPPEAPVGDQIAPTTGDVGPAKADDDEEPQRRADNRPIVHPPSADVNQWYLHNPLGSEPTGRPAVKDDDGPSHDAAALGETEDKSEPEAPQGAKDEAEPKLSVEADDEAGEQPAAASAAQDETDERFQHRQRDQQVRFAWATDTRQAFTLVSSELTECVGPNAADVIGRRWSDVARVFGFDDSGDIQSLLEKQDTWSGKSVLWPIQGTDLVVPIDLAALPLFSGGRTFDGFRGYGIVRMGDTVIDPNEIGLALTDRRPQPEQPEPAESDTPEIAESGPDADDDSDIRVRLADDDQETVAPALFPASNIVDFSSVRAGDEAPLTTAETAVTAPEPVSDPVEPAAAPVDTSVLDKLPVPVVVFRNGVTLYANPELLELSGYNSVEQLHAAGGVDALFGGHERGDIDDGRDVTLTDRQGRTMQVSALLQTVPWGDEKALLLSFRHPRVTEPSADERVALDMMRVSELQNILDAATDGILIMNGEGTIESINASAEALFNRSFDEVNGKPIGELFATDSHQILTDYLGGLSQPGVKGILNSGREVVGREAGGGLIPLFITIGSAGSTDRYCAVLRDMTSWKQTHEELEAARKAAESASDMKTEFLTRVSHEIRTPLNSIIGFSDVMIEERFGPVENERYREYLRDINRSGVHVLDLINDLLDISKIEAGKMELSFESVDLNEIVGESVALLQPQANGNRVLIRTSLSRAVPNVVADARSIRQIVLNLVSNAIKFTPENGQIVVSTVYEDSGEVAVRVRDSGKGMSEADIRDAMKPFHQINSVDAPRGSGTGLGLPLTKALVEANKAMFAIESMPEEGTIARMQFPSQRVLADRSPT